MRKFIVGRLLSIIPVLIIVSVVIFSVVHLTPGDPAASILGAEATVGRYRGAPGEDGAG